MNLEALHTVVRALARGERASSVRPSTVSPAERAALRALERRLHRAGGELHRLVPVANALEWLAAPRARIAD